MAGVGWAIYGDVQASLATAQRQLKIEADNRLARLRDGYASSTYASWARNWTDVVDRVVGSGPLRSHSRQLTIPLNADLASYAFDSPACRRFDGEAGEPLLACVIYNPSSRRLQVVAAWTEPAWAVVREGDRRVDHGDRLLLELKGTETTTIAISPQVPLRTRARLDQCAADWQATTGSRRMCNTIAVAAHRVSSNSLLGASWPRATGIAIRGDECPAQVRSPCVVIAVSLLVTPPEAERSICVRRLDSGGRLEASTIRTNTCRASGDAIPGQFLDLGFRVRSQEASACAAGYPCLCEQANADHASCLRVEGTRRTQSPSPALPSIGLRIAEALIDLALRVEAVDTVDARADIRGHAGGKPLAYLVERVPLPAIAVAAAPSISGRLTLYFTALIMPVALFLAMGLALRHARAVARAAERAEQAARLETQQRIVEAERDAARAAQSLSESALKGATASLEDLGHEIVSPAQSLRNTLDQLQQTAALRPEWAALLRESFVGLMDGYISRIVRASERVRFALQLRRRHAESVRTHDIVNLGPYLRQRLQAEQLLGTLDVQLLGAELDARIVADPGALEEVVGNLLSNARRFGVGHPIRVEMTLDRPLVRIAIRNEGPIVPRGEEERIFEAGRSLSPGTDASSHGHGLFVARMAMSAMGGTIVVENDPGVATHGVTFVLTFPVVGAIEPISSS